MLRTLFHGSFESFIGVSSLAVYHPINDAPLGVLDFLSDIYFCTLNFSKTFDFSSCFSPFAVPSGEGSSSARMSRCLKVRANLMADFRLWISASVLFLP